MSGLANRGRSGEPLRFRFAGGSGGSFEREAVGRKSAEDLRAVADGNGVVKMLVDGHVTALHGTSPGLPVDLEGQIVVLDGVVAVDGPLALDGEDAVEVGADGGHKSGGLRIGSLRGEPLVELANIGLKKAVGGLKRGDVPDPSCGNLPCQARKDRSLRPRAWGE